MEQYPLYTHIAIVAQVSDVVHGPLVVVSDRWNGLLFTTMTFVYTFKTEGGSLSNHREIDASRNYSGGTITSPGFPGNYTHNASYTWTFNTGNPKSIVHLTFDFLQIFEYQNHTPRCKDFLQVKNVIWTITLFDSL